MPCRDQLRLPQAKAKRAKRKCRPVYGWFTEGFDTADLKEAKVLLNKMS